MLVKGLLLLRNLQLKVRRNGLSVLW